jgi:hypothetical protein
MRNVVVALLSIVGSVTIASVGNAQSGQDNPSRTKTPAARISQSHQELAIRAKKDTRRQRAANFRYFLKRCIAVAPK